MNQETTPITRLATVTFGRCFEVSQIDWFVPLAEADEEEYDYVDSCPAVLNSGEEFEVSVEGVAVTYTVPATATKVEVSEVMVEPAENQSGQIDVLRYATFEVELNGDEQFDPALVDLQSVLFGDEVVGLTPVSYSGDTDRLLFVESDSKDRSFFNWVDDSFTGFSSFDEMVEEYT